MQQVIFEAAEDVIFGSFHSFSSILAPQSVILHRRFISLDSSYLEIHHDSISGH